MDMSFLYSATEVHPLLMYIHIEVINLTYLRRKKNVLPFQNGGHLKFFASRHCAIPQNLKNHFPGGLTPCQAMALFLPELPTITSNVERFSVVRPEYRVGVSSSSYSLVFANFQFVLDILSYFGENGGRK